MSKRTIYIVGFFIVVIVLCGFTWWFRNNTQTLQYCNDQYGFTFALPQGWKGYTILVQTWTGTSHCSSSSTGYCQTDSGPEIVIRNPNWIADKPWQDIPIMVFTPDQWNLIQQGTLSVDAAPVPPTELGSNSQYVFALPAKYDMAALEGGLEVDNILRNHPLSTQQPDVTPTATNDHTAANEAAIRTFMGEPDLQFSDRDLQNPSNFTIGKMEALDAQGSTRIVTPPEWERKVYIFNQTNVASDNCQFYSYEVDAQSGKVVQVQLIGALAVGSESELESAQCEKNRTHQDITNAQAESLALSIARKDVPNLNESAGKVFFDKGGDRYIWMWQDTSYKLRAGLTSEPWQYPTIRVILDKQGRLMTYLNTTFFYAENQ